MDHSQFEECRKIKGYDRWMETALRFDDLSAEDYSTFMPVIFEIVPGIKERDPVVFYEEVIYELRKKWVASESLPFHGPWHHGLVAGILIASLRNNGYEFTDEDIGEALKRGLMVPAGGCGFLGICGAGAGLGIALSIIQGSTPFHETERSKCLDAAKEAFGRIARLGGPRCCTLSTYTTLNLAGRVLSDLGYELPVSRVGGRCIDYKLNSECHLEKCPYFPGEV
ncbi:MAG: hypothetical protein JXA49_06490 [Actinobacteria bacterium]|nr:hypothetical protein [Actinomycetota bacterium]